jgi:hypothetical protein
MSEPVQPVTSAPEALSASIRRRRRAYVVLSAGRLVCLVGSVALPLPKPARLVLAGGAAGLSAAAAVVASPSPRRGPAPQVP